MGPHPGQTLAHSSTAKGRGFLLPGSNFKTQSSKEIQIPNFLYEKVLTLNCFDLPLTFEL
jgi:hypothetical protein